MKKLFGWVSVVLVGCGGPSFQGFDVSMVPDADLGVDTEVDTQADGGFDMRADMVNQGETSVTTEASSDANGSVDGGVGVDDGGRSDVGDAPLEQCPASEVFPNQSPTCRMWILTTPYPSLMGCCLPDQTCGFMRGPGYPCEPLPSR